MYPTTKQNGAPGAANEGKKHVNYKGHVESFFFTKSVKFAIWRRKMIASVRFTTGVLLAENMINAAIRWRNVKTWAQSLTLADPFIYLGYLITLVIYDLPRWVITGMQSVWQKQVNGEFEDTVLD
jgi:hypothetical protein